MEQVKKVIVLSSLIFLIGFKSYGQTDSSRIIVGTTHFTAPNYMLIEWRNLQKNYDYQLKDRKIIETDRNTCLNDKQNLINDRAAIIEAYKESDVKLNNKIKKRNKIITILSIVTIVETAVIIIF